MQVAAKCWRQCERCARGIYGDGSAACGIHADSDDAPHIEVGVGRPGLRNHAGDGGHQTIEVILRILPRNMRVPGIEQNAMFTAGVGKDRCRQLISIRQIHQKCAAGIGPVINAK
jgi:hypothetical protein